MKKNAIKIRYSDVNNLGDQLNVLIMQDLFGVNFVHTPNYYDYDIMGIGSHLHEAFRIKHRRILGTVLDSLLCDTIGSKTCFTWGTGFIRSNSFPLVLRRKNIKFTAVRGKLSLSDIRAANVDTSDTVLGDAGILAAQLISSKVGKIHKIGFIPHFKEQHEESVRSFISKNPDLFLIDLKADYYKTIKDIASCEMIISSSLHGLIIADAFRIPDCYIKFTYNPLGDGFKFRDYYSNYDLSMDKVTITKMGKITQNDIIDIYKTDVNQIAQMEKNMYDAMKKILLAIKYTDYSEVFE